MGTLTLRDLAKDYAKGAIERDAYRRDRAALIDGILNGSVRVEAIDFSAPVVNRPVTDETGPGKRNRQAAANAAELDALDVFDITQVVPSGEVTPPRPDHPPSRAAPTLNNAHSSLPLVIVGSIAIVAVLGLVAVLIINKTSAPVATPVAETPALTGDSPAGISEPVATMPAAANSATDALAEFLLAKNWSDESLDQFQSRWLALPQADRDAAAGSGEILQVANAAYRKLQEIRALSQVSDAATTQQKEGKLLAFAGSLGISDTRLTPQAADDTSTSK